jgi:hypothetical protein
MERSQRTTGIYDWLWFLAWAIASSVWCWTAARQLGATFDEPIYVARGLEVWRTGSHQGLMQLGTMPLPVDVDTLPLYLWERWHGTRLDPVEDLERILPWARAGTLLFWWLLLFYARLAGRQLAGPWGGRAAVALVASEPNLLAHASLATTDLAITACLMALVYHFRVGREAGWVRRVALPAFWFGATVLAKASGLVFGPLCLVAVLLLGTSGSLVPGAAGQVWAARRDLRQILLGGLLIVFLYCGSDWRPQASFVEWAHRLPENTSGRVMVWCAEHLRIFSNAGEGLVRQVKHNMRGHGTYLLGQVAERSIWYYFPVALTIKLCLSLLILPGVLALLRPRALLNWACLAALVLLLFSLSCRVQIGIRLVLPLIVLATVGLSAAAVRAATEASAECLLGVWRRRLATVALMGAVIWTTLAAIRVWPNGLCYTNELWGGTARGYLALSDSNYDWGQGLKELNRWHKKHAEAPLAVWYFGTDPALRRLPLEEVRLHTLPISTPEDVHARVRGHYLAVSTSLLYGSLGTVVRSGPPQEAEAYQNAIGFLRDQQPTQRTSTFLIYDFREKR